MTNLIMVLIVSAWKPQVPLAKTCHMLYLTFKGSGSISMEVLPGIFPEMLIFFFPNPKSQSYLAKKLGKLEKVMILLQDLKWKNQHRDVTSSEDSLVSS